MFFQFSSRIEPILLRMNPIHCIIGFAKKLSTIKNHTFRDVMTVLSWLKCVAEANVTRVILDSLTVLEDDGERENEETNEFDNSRRDEPDVPRVRNRLHQYSRKSFELPSRRHVK